MASWYENSLFGPIADDIAAGCSARNCGPRGRLRFGRAFHPPGGRPRAGRHRRRRGSGRNPARAREGLPCRERRQSHARVPRGGRGRVAIRGRVVRPRRQHLLDASLGRQGGRTQGGLAGASARVAGADLGPASRVLAVPPADARPARRTRRSAARIARRQGVGVALRLHVLPAARAGTTARAGNPWAGNRRARLTWLADSPRSTCSRTRRTSATRSRSCSTATA